MKKIIEGSVMPNFLLKSIEQLNTYYTPDKVLKYIKTQNKYFLIANPPFNVKK